MAQNEDRLKVYKGWAKVFDVLFLIGLVFLVIPGYLIDLKLGLTLTGLALSLVGIIGGKALGKARQRK